jgi:hypothetical protein
LRLTVSGLVEFAPCRCLSPTALERIHDDEPHAPDELNLEVDALAVPIAILPLGGVQRSVD